MINRIYRLIDTKRIEMVMREVVANSASIITTPDYITVCAADQRYYLGKRRREVLRTKLPMALIHEATATVKYDLSKQLNNAEKVVLVPLKTETSDLKMKANYNPNSMFQSSGVDGFLQDYVTTDTNGLIPITDNYSVVYVFCEVLSVIFNAIEAFESICVNGKESFGIWGDGNIGYIAGLVIRCLYPDSKIYSFGKTARKLERFSFSDEVFYIDDVPKGLQIDNCFECVGDVGSESAIRQIISMISPQGCVSLLGVSEEEISINTRSILDKGLRIIGNSRSTRDDFVKAVNLIQTSNTCRRYLETLISEVIEIHNEKDIVRLFEQDMLNDFKTVGKWMI